MLTFNTYAENIRMAAKTGSATRRPMDIKDLSRATGYKYEHIRKLWMGDHTKYRFSVSRECNDRLATVLGLDKDELWALANREKVTQRIGYEPARLEDPKGTRLTEIWGNLLDEHKDVLIRMAEGFRTEAQHDHAFGATG